MRQETEPAPSRKESMRATQNEIALERASHEQESQFQQRVREMLNNLPTTTRNRERFTINRTTIKVSTYRRAKTRLRLADA